MTLRGGDTAENTEGRVQGLANKLNELNSEKNIYIGGIVVQEPIGWFYFDTNRFVKFNEEKDYNYNFIPSES